MSTQELEEILSEKIKLTQKGRGIAELIAEIESVKGQTVSDSDDFESALMVQFYQLLKNASDNVFGTR